jgi:hypothetical protein
MPPVGGILCPIQPLDPDPLRLAALAFHLAFLAVDPLGQRPVVEQASLVVQSQTKQHHEYQNHTATHK